MSVESPPVRLDTVQALRGVAALLVVLFHAASIWREGTGGAGLAGPWDGGWAGVDLFFVISGFVMVWVTADRAGGARPAGRFLFDRATRIYPLWWVFCSLMGLYFLLTYGQPASPATLADGSPLSVFACSLALWPLGDQPVLGVGWTLTFEIAFYALFAVLMLLRSRWRLPLIGLWGGVLLYLLVTTPPTARLPDSWAGVLLSPLCLEFVLGAGVAAWIR
ncbi:MAG: acyltransferase, partial [Litorimonas sp.]